MGFLAYFALFNSALDLADRIEKRVRGRDVARFRKYGVWQSFDRVLYEMEQEITSQTGKEREEEFK